MATLPKALHPEKPSLWSIKAVIIGMAGSNELKRYVQINYCRNSYKHG